MGLAAGLPDPTPGEPSDAPVWISGVQGMAGLDAIVQHDSHGGRRPLGHRCSVLIASTTARLHSSKPTAAADACPAPVRMALEGGRAIKSVAQAQGQNLQLAGAGSCARRRSCSRYISRAVDHSQFCKCEDAQTEAWACKERARNGWCWPRGLGPAMEAALGRSERRRRRAAGAQAGATALCSRVIEVPIQRRSLHGLVVSFLGWTGGSLAH